MADLSKFPAHLQKLLDDVPQSEWLTLRRKIPVKTAAAINDMHEDTYRKHHGNTIKRVSPRRDAVELGDALAVGQSKD